MVLKTRVLAILMIMLTALGLWAQEPPRPGEVSLPLKDYLSLVETVERLERERARKNAQQEKPLAEVVSQRLRVVLGDGETAEVTAEFEVLVQGDPKGPVSLPVACVPQEVEVKGPADAVDEHRPASAVTAGARSGEMHLVAPAPGRYSVRIAGPLSVGRGVARLNLPPAAAPVAVMEIELPADRVFTAPGAVVVDDREAGGVRTLQLTTRRGEPQTVEIRRKVENGEAEKLLAQSVVLTLLQLLPDGPSRHDVVLYEVSRGGLGSLTVDLPPGVAVEQAGTDEGDVIPVVESRRLTVHRRNQLRTTGYLVLTSTPAPGAEMPLEPVTPAVEARARYLALASAVAADVRPLPETGWARVDLDDLPPSLREAVSSVDLAAAWRLTSPPADARVAVSLLPPASALPLLVRRRDTTSLLTVDGTLLHRDRLTLRPPDGVGAALDVALPSGAKLWSAQVDDLPVRPLERANGAISVPLGFETGKEPVIEIVSVLEKAIPSGRSELALGLPQVGAPVEEHRWRLLLPDGPRYRYRSGDLRPAGVAPARSASARVPAARDPWVILQETPGIATDRINVGGNEAQGGRVYGKVVDDQLSVLPGVTVTLTGPLAPLIQVTDAQGAFRFLNLSPGTYSLKAELEGFSSIEYPNIPVNVGRITHLDVTMSAGVEDVITVTSEAPLLDERRVGNTQTITADELGTGGAGGGGRLRSRKKPATPAESPAYYDFDAFEEMKSLEKGLVGGVKPLPIVIPETGKLLLMTGVLPPAQVGVELEVRAKR